MNLSPSLITVAHTTAETAEDVPPGRLQLVTLSLLVTSPAVASQSAAELVGRVCQHVRLVLAACPGSSTRTCGQSLRLPGPATVGILPAGAGKFHDKVRRISRGLSAAKAGLADGKSRKISKPQRMVGQVRGEHNLKPQRRRAGRRQKDDSKSAVNRPSTQIFYV
eukprot:g6737.t1